MRDILSVMAFRGPRQTFCPACDGPLPQELSTQAAPACPACNETLLAVRVASTPRRAAAAAIDILILLATAGALNVLLLGLVGGPAVLGDAKGLDALLRVLEQNPLDLLRRIAPAMGMSAIYLGLFWALKGRTPGGRVLGVRVVDWRGRNPHPVWAAVRVLANFIGLSLGALGWIWAALDPQRRALHDHVARTYVVRDA